MAIRKLHLLAVFRNDSEKLSAMPDVSAELFMRMAEFLGEKVGQCRAIIANQFLSGTEENFDEQKIQDLMNEKDEFKLVSLQSLCGKNQLASPYSRFDAVNNRNYIGLLPVFIETDQELDEFVRFNNEMLTVFGSAFDDLDSFSLGFGSTNGLFSLFEKDFDCLFSIAEALGVNNKSESYEAHETIQTETENGIFVIPHFPISAIATAYGQSNISLIDKFTERLRVFRATTTVMDILEKKYVVIRGVYRWLNEALDPDEAKLYLQNPLGDIYEETLVANIQEEKLDSNMPVTMDTFDDASTGTLCSIVNWSKDDRLMMMKIVYPTKHDSVHLIRDKQEELQRKFSSIESKMIELDGTNESLLSSLFEKEQKLLGQS